MLDLFEFETTPDGGGDGGGDATPAEPEAVVEPVAEAQVAGEAWTPSQEEFQSMQERLAEQEQFIAAVTAQAQGQPQEQQYEAPALDPFDENFGANLAQLIRDTVSGVVQPAVGPLLEQQQTAQALEWAEHMYDRLGLPESQTAGDRGDLWRTATLAAGKAYEIDQYGRPVDAGYAVTNGHRLITQLVEAERQAAVDEYKATLAADRETLNNRANAPTTPASAGAGIEGIPADLSIEQATRLWAEKHAAANAA